MAKKDQKKQSANITDGDNDNVRATSEEIVERGMFDGQIAGNTKVNETEVRRTGKIPASVEEAASDTTTPLTPSAQNAAEAKSRTGLTQSQRTGTQ